jgi:hypothetical protein
VLQNRDVEFKPPLPTWKMEGIYSMKMVCIAVPVQPGFSFERAGDVYEDLFAVSI